MKNFSTQKTEPPPDTMRSTPMRFKWGLKLKRRLKNTLAWIAKGSKNTCPT